MKDEKDGDVVCVCVFNDDQSHRQRKGGRTDKENIKEQAKRETQRKSKKDERNIQAEDGNRHSPRKK